MTTNILCHLIFLLTTNTSYVVDNGPHQMLFTNGAVVVTNQVTVVTAHWCEVRTEYLVTPYGKNRFTNEIGSAITRQWDTAATNLWFPPTAIPPSLVGGGAFIPAPMPPWMPSNGSGLP